MKRKVIVLVLLCFFGIQHPTYADTHEWIEINRLSDEALLLTKQERYKEAGALLKQISSEFMKDRIGSPHILPEDIRVLTINYNEALAALGNNEIDRTEKVREMTKLRLLVDALQSEHQPLWTEMEDNVMSAFEQLKTTASTGDPISFQQQFNVFLSHYETILPSVQVDMRSEHINRMDAHLAFLNQSQSNSFNDISTMRQLEQMEVDLKELFKKMKEEETDSSLIWMMVTTGSIIIFTLSYVGLRKYYGLKIQYGSR